MRRLALVLVSVALACQHPYFVPEVPVPSAQRLKDLARVGRRAEVKESPFRISVMPPIILAGSATWVTCYSSTVDERHAIRWGIEGIAMSEAPLDRIEHKRLIERVPCGTHLAVCLLSDGQRREAKIEARGSCNAEDG